MWDSNPRQCSGAALDCMPIIACDQRMVNGSAKGERELPTIYSCGPSKGSTSPNAEAVQPGSPSAGSSIRARVEGPPLSADGSLTLTRAYPRRSEAVYPLSPKAACSTGQRCRSVGAHWRYGGSEPVLRLPQQRDVLRPVGSAVGIAGESPQQKDRRGRRPFLVSIGRMSEHGVRVAVRRT
jgi:hypothetical protein